VLEAEGSSNIMKMPGWGISDQVEQAKTLLASMLNCYLAAVNPTTTGPRLTIAGPQKMRRLPADSALRSSMTMDPAVDECFVPPPIAISQAKTLGEVGDCLL